MLELCFYQIDGELVEEISSINIDEDAIDIVYDDLLDFVRSERKINVISVENNSRISGHALTTRSRDKLYAVFSPARRELGREGLTQLRDSINDTRNDYIAIYLSD